MALLLAEMMTCSPRVRMGQLMKEGKVRRSYWTPDDRSLKRWISHQINQYHYRQQYRVCFNHCGIDDEALDDEVLDDEAARNMEKLGVLGELGPAATVRLLARVVHHIQAGCGASASDLIGEYEL